MDLSPDEESFPGRLLHQAALWDNAELVLELLLAGTSALCLDSWGRSALHAAALADGARCLPLLLAHGAPVDHQALPHTGAKTALHIAAERGHLENVRVLLDAGANTDLLDSEGLSALQLAERAFHKRCAALIAEHTAAVERRRLDQHQRLREAVSSAPEQLRPLLAELPAAERTLLVNMAPAASNTLLYLASEAGSAEAVRALVEAGADGRSHPVTRRSPLHAAVYLRHVEVARLLLQHYPELAQECSVEGWLPLHAAAMRGHGDVITVLLTHNYPPHMMNTYTEAGSGREYQFAFDVNAADASGHSALYAACVAAHAHAPAALLTYVIPAPPSRDAPIAEEKDQSTEANETKGRMRISLGIQAIVSRLKGKARPNMADTRAPPIRPVRTDTAPAGDSCLGAAVRSGHLELVTMLLEAGADPDAVSLSHTQSVFVEPRGRRQVARDRSCTRPLSSHKATTAVPSSSSSDMPRIGAPRSASTSRLSHVANDPHYEICREGERMSALAAAVLRARGDMARALLRAGASDAGALAVRAQLAAMPADEELLAMLLATKCHPESEYKVNKSAMGDAILGAAGAPSAECVTYSALYPSTPVAVNWRQLHAPIYTISMRWLAAGCLRVNSKLSAGGRQMALHALTRLDVSGNQLTRLPHQLFALASLRYLNAGQNKLECLPGDAAETNLPRGKTQRPASVYTAPVLDELYLQDNRLESLPEDLFSLKSLAVLDVSNNKVHALPAAVWRAPALHTLSAALNHLRELPTLGSSTAPAMLSPQKEIEDGFVNLDSDCAKESSLLLERSANAVCAEVPSELDAAASQDGERDCDGAVEGEDRASGTASRLTALNLAHNQLTCVPQPLACLAPALQRLNLSYNSLRSMSYVTSYPRGLRHLDLSHNHLTCWPSLPQADDPGCVSFTACYGEGVASGGGATGGVASGGGASGGGACRKRLVASLCSHRRHLRLLSLRTLVVSNNMLTRIQLTTDEDPDQDDQAADHYDPAQDRGIASRVVFPSVSMLDVSHNLLRGIPPQVHALHNLAVLNINGNKEISSLPPTLGLLTRLWSVGATDCSIAGEPGRILRDPRRKTTHLLAHLRSVLDHAVHHLELKLMLVGAMAAGKSSLLECLRQESPPHLRRKPTEHWTRRVRAGSGGKGGGNMSTVGVDIGTWVYDRRPHSADAARPRLTFRTWDFAGQREYYATHQYFLSWRALYLVVWRITDGRAGLAHALAWLRCIQARAPGAHVIMVGTHYDAVSQSAWEGPDSPEALQRVIRSRMMGAGDADKLGLPRVVDSLEVSCRTRHNVRLLADALIAHAYALRAPGSKEPVLEQKVPASYLHLEECANQLAGTPAVHPVLNYQQYKAHVKDYFASKGYQMFRDEREMQNATRFLHDNGVVLHWEDANLKQLYFIRPQWLCDTLAHVLAVREVNPFHSHGIMRVDDLPLLLKSWWQGAGSVGASGVEGGGAGDEGRALCLSLLAKFELALPWPGELLLVPPLLPPTETQHVTVKGGCGWSGRTRRFWMPLAAQSHHAAAVPAHAVHDLNASGERTDSPQLYGENEESEGACGVTLSAVASRDGGDDDEVGGIRRVVCALYVPVGFWPRLVARLLSDGRLQAALGALYPPPGAPPLDRDIDHALCEGWSWRVWQAGVSAHVGGAAAMKLRQRRAPPAPHAPLASLGSLDALHSLSLMDDPAHQQLYPYRLLIRGEGGGWGWAGGEGGGSAVIELLLPMRALRAARRRCAHADPAHAHTYQSVCIEACLEGAAKVLAVVQEHIDLLLEDWYPAIGCRFVQTSEGRALIVRAVPCALCVLRPSAAPLHAQPPSQHAQPAPPRRSRDSADDADSGVGHDSNASSRLPSVEGALGLEGAALGAVEGAAEGAAEGAGYVYAWTVEECVAAICESTSIPALICPVHSIDGAAGSSPLSLARLAPDLVVLDVPADQRVRREDLTLHKLLGRGSFGHVYLGTWRGRQVAVKAVQPVPAPPVEGAPGSCSARAAWRAARARWKADAPRHAHAAYCALRQELAVTACLKHRHVCEVVGVCVSPLALVCEVAPGGSLHAALRQYRAAGAAVGPRAARLSAMHVARALDYLHAHRIIYRDLKSENVLVWQMPPPEQSQAAERNPKPLDLLLKLADYGISRMCWGGAGVGAKGFGGTEGFMAPEIVQYNGEREYDEKVDCFSFGMLLYEILSLRQPYEGYDAVKDALLDGLRPTVTQKVTSYGACPWRVLRACWREAGARRPSAAALCSVLAAPEYLALLHAHALAASPACTARPDAASVPAALHAPDESGCGEVWWGGGGQLYAISFTPASLTRTYTVRTLIDETAHITSICSVGDSVWVGDSTGSVTSYNARSMRATWSRSVWSGVGVAVGGRGATGVAEGAGVAAILHLPALHRVALAMSNGRLFLVRCECAGGGEEAPGGGEEGAGAGAGAGEWVVSELGAATSLSCLAALDTIHFTEVWCAGAGVWWYRCSSSGVRAARCLREGGAPVTLMAAAPNAPFVYTHSAGGEPCVEQWAGGGVCGKLALGHLALAPCSETLNTLATDAETDAARSVEVVSLACGGGHVLAGVRWGCVVVAEAATLRPLTVCRPYAARPVAMVTGRAGATLALGWGHRPLLDRFLPQNSDTDEEGVEQNKAAWVWTLWRAHHWTPD